MNSKNIRIENILHGGGGNGCGAGLIANNANTSMVLPNFREKKFWILKISETKKHLYCKPNPISSAKIPPILCGGFANDNVARWTSK